MGLISRVAAHSNGLASAPAPRVPSIALGSQAPVPGGGGAGVAVAPPPAPVPRKWPATAGRSASEIAATGVAISRDLKARVKNRVIAELDPDMDMSRTADVRQRIKTLFDAVLDADSWC